MQAFAGDLSEKETDAVKQHAERCEKCRLVAEEMTGNIARFEADRERQFSLLMARIDTESGRPGRRIIERRRLVGSMAAAAAVLIALSVGLLRQSVTTDPDPVAFKGQFTVEVVAKRDNDQFVVRSGNVLYEDDALRFVVTTHAPGYLAVFSRDSDGKVWHYYPETDPKDDPAPMPVEAPGRHELPGSVILDDTLGNEQFVVVFSPEKFDREQLVDAWESAEQVDEITELRKDIVVESIWIKKEDHPRP